MENCVSHKDSCQLILLIIIPTWPNKIQREKIQRTQIYASASAM